MVAMSLLESRLLRGGGLMIDANINFNGHLDYAVKKATYIAEHYLRSEMFAPHYQTQHRSGRKQ